MTHRLRPPRASVVRSGLRDADPATHCRFESLENRAMMSVSQDSGGWTVVAPSADSRVIFVSSSAGDDAKNSGLSASSPVRSIAKGRSLLRNGMPDHLLLKRGDVWQESLSGTSWNLSGRDADEPMLISTWGSASAARPLLKTGVDKAFNLNGAAVHDLVIKGIHFQAHTRDTDSGSFTGTAGSYGLRLVGSATRLIIEDNQVESYESNISLDDYNGRHADVQVRRNVIADAYPTASSGKSQGMYVEGVDGIRVEGNLFDHNGWNEQVSWAVASIYNHNLYMQSTNEGAVVSDNIFANASSHGLQARSGGDIRNNLFLRNPCHMSFGFVNGADAKPGGVSGTVEGNVFLDSRDINGSARGMALSITNTRAGAGTSVRNNIFAHDTSGAHAAIRLDVGTDVYNAADAVGVNDLTVEGNITYKWHQGFYSAAGFVPGGTGLTALNDLTVRDNDFQQVKSNRLVRHSASLSSAEETWSANRYADSDASSSGWFELAGTGTSLSAWRAQAEPTAISASGTYAEPERTIATYNASVGGAASLDNFLDNARQQRQGYFRSDYVSAAVVNYVRRGFAEGGVIPGGEVPLPSVFEPFWITPESQATWNAATNTLTVTGPTTIVADPGANPPTINATGTSAVLTIDPASRPDVHFGALNLANGATAKIASLGAARTAANHRVLIVNAISIDAGSTLDITDNDVIVDYAGPASLAGAVEDDVASAYNVTGDWRGHGITSSVAALDGNYAVAVADNAALAAPFGLAQGGPLFAAVDVDLTTVLVKFTQRGDVDLDGAITPNDSAIFGGSYSENEFANWATGDMDYDGLFTPTDGAIFGGFYDESFPRL